MSSCFCLLTCLCIGGKILLDAFFVFGFISESLFFFRSGGHKPSPTPPRSLSVFLRRSHYFSFLVTKFGVSEDSVSYEAVYGFGLWLDPRILLQSKLWFAAQLTPLLSETPLDQEADMIYPFFAPCLM